MSMEFFPKKGFENLVREKYFLPPNPHEWIIRPYNMHKSAYLNSALNIEKYGLNVGLYIGIERNEGKCRKTLGNEVAVFCLRCILYKPINGMCTTLHVRLVSYNPIYNDLYKIIS